jgi:hypothetical protein
MHFQNISLVMPKFYRDEVDIYSLTVKLKLLH